MQTTNMTESVRIRDSCRICGSRSTTKIIDLGNQALPGWLDRPTTPDYPRVPLILMKCDDCDLVQLDRTVARDLLFKHFWYRSGISSTIQKDLREIAFKAFMEARYNLSPVVIDVGSNDGTLLKFFRATFPEHYNPLIVGFEPAANVIGDSRLHAEVVTDYFSAWTWKDRYGQREADIVTAIAMFYDLEDPVAILKDMAGVLAPEGVLIIQMNYLVSMIKNNAYDNICHEHVTYFSLMTLEQALTKADLKVYKVEENDINGGSFRAYICHNSSRRRPDDSVAKMRYREMKGLNGQSYQQFTKRIQLEKHKLTTFLEACRRRGELVAIYGASTRGHTIIEYCHLYDGMISCAVDNNRDKWGRWIAGPDIKIQQPDMTPDYFLLLPYHLKDEIMMKEKAYLDGGGRFIVPLPTVKILPSNRT